MHHSSEPNPLSGDASAEVQPKSEKPKLPTVAHFLCGWPLLLVAVGGAIGGGLGGAAYGVNVGIYQSNLPAPVKVLLNLATGCAAIAIWLAIAAGIHSARQ